MMAKYIQLNKILWPAFVCAVLLAFPIRTNAQTKAYNEEITVIAPYEPTIPDAYKISLSPKTGDSDFKIPKLNYSIKSKPYDTHMEVEPLSPVKMVSEPLTKLYRNYFRVGMGTYLTPYAELFANTLRSKDHALGVHIKHLSSSGNLDDYAFSGSSTNLAEVTGSKFTAAHTLSGKFFYERDVVHHYGFRTADFDTIPGKDDLRQRFNIAGMEAGYKSNYTEKDKLNHAFGLSYYHLADLFEAREDHIKFDASADKQFKLFDLTDLQQAGLALSINHYAQRDSLGKLGSNIVGIKPFISTNYEEYSFYAGLNISVASDSITRMHIYPLLEAKLRIIPNALEIYAGISGNLNRQNYRDLAAENPFINSDLKLAFTYEKFKFYGGVTSNIGRNLDLSAAASISTFENMPFFVNDTISPLENKFTLVYDDVNLLRLSADATFRSTDKLSMTIHGAYQKFDMTSEEKPWHKPATSLGFTGRYNIREKIVVTGDVTWNGKSYARELLRPEGRTINRTFKTTELKGYADVSLGLEYRYTKLLSAFMQFNNIGNVRYYRWNNYPSQRFNFMAGITFTF
ncbi:MAG TPA: hypothetical protein VF298_00955 [Bacteroidales bacterium]